MKKLNLFFLLLVGIMAMPTAFAADTANLRMDFNVTNNHDYYLCLTDFGCLRIIPGRVYPIYESVDMSGLYLLDASERMRISPLSSSSCNVDVKKGQTVTISGTIGDSGSYARCSVR